MLAAIRRFLAEMGGDDKKVAVGEDDIQLAAAALLFHVVAVDGIVSDGERARYASVHSLYAGAPSS